jgi:inner membrane protease ATP23
MAPSEVPASPTSEPVTSPDSPTILHTGNKFFQRWQKNFSLLTGYGIGPDERMYEINRRNCEKWKRELLHLSAWAIHAV